jgi:hypothetical protein
MASLPRREWRATVLNDFLFLCSVRAKVEHAPTYQANGEALERRKSLLRQSLQEKRHKGPLGIRLSYRLRVTRKVSR